MLIEVTLQNFKCFRQHSIPLRPTTIVVGRNNAGKSTIVEALRLVSLVSNRLQNLPVRDVPSWLDIPTVNRGVSPSLNNQSFDFGNVFHRYGEPPAKITARFSSGVGITIYIGGPERVHAVIKDSRRNVVISKGQARNIGVPKVGILPQIGPLAATETILVPDYVRKFMSSNLSTIHFRNELNLLFDEAFAEFKDISEATWHGLAIQELRGQGRRHGSDLGLMVRNDDFVAEVGWMGHGLQMWLQIMWFLARCVDFETVILDEPDVYMHADLQRKLIRFLKSRHQQVIIATHSVEIMSEVEPENILVVDREKRQAQFTTDVPEVQKVVDQIGAIQNLQLARLWGSHRCLFVEGKDIGLLKQFQNKLFPSSPDPIDAIPSMSVGGWSGWNYAVGSSMLLSTAIGQRAGGAKAEPRDIFRVPQPCGFQGAEFDLFSDPCQHVDTLFLQGARTTMKARVKKWGNSASVRIPSAVLQAAKLRLEDSVDVREESGRIVIEPVPRKEYDLSELLKRITRENLHGEVDFGKPVGKEAW